MGTDRIKLFNKTLADQILAMELQPLANFLTNNASVLKQKKFVSNPVFNEVEENGGAMAEALERLLSDGYTLAGLKSEIVEDFAFGDKEISLDYWGCYAEVFVVHPAGSISSLDYLFDQEEEHFLLLLPNHVDQIIESLYAHLDDVKRMGKEKIEEVVHWRDYCLTNPGYMVAYEFDF